MCVYLFDHKGSLSGSLNRQHLTFPTHTLRPPTILPPIGSPSPQRPPQNPFLRRDLSPSPSFSPSPSTKFSNKTWLFGRQKYTRLYLSQLACVPGGGTTRWMLLLSRPPENFTSASPRFTMQCPGRGRTYAQPSWHRTLSDSEQGEEDEGEIGATEAGSLTCRPPRRLNKMVTEPKSVCSPKATEEEVGCCGGARTKRIWSPEGEERACKPGSPSFSLTSSRRSSRLERRDVTSMHSACEEAMYPLQTPLC